MEELKGYPSAESETHEILSAASMCEHTFSHSVLIVLELELGQKPPQVSQCLLRARGQNSIMLEPYSGNTVERRSGYV